MADQDNSADDGREPAPVWGEAWGGPVDGQRIGAVHDPTALYAVRGTGRLCTLVDGRGHLRELRLARPDARGGWLVDPAVAGYYTTAGARAGRFRFVDLEGLRPPAAPPAPLDIVPPVALTTPPLPTREAPIPRPQPPQPPPKTRPPHAPEGLTDAEADDLELARIQLALMAEAAEADRWDWCDDRALA